MGQQLGRTRVLGRLKVVMQLPLLSWRPGLYRPGSVDNRAVTEPDALEPIVGEVRGQLLECWRRARDATGTAYVLELRATRTGLRLKLLTFVSFVVPIVVGTLVLAYGAGLQVLALIISIAGLITIVQVTFSLWALTAGWVDGYNQSIRSAITNRDLADRFARMARQASPGAADLGSYFHELVGRDEGQRSSDYALGFSEAETRAAHRAGLREYGQKCVACGTVPTDMSPTDRCGVCSDFKQRRFGIGFKSSQ